MPTPNYLTIIGNIGSGKSTAMPLLLKALDAQPLYADDLFQTLDPFRDLYLKDIPRWAFTNELWLTYERSKMIQEYGAQKSGGQGTAKTNQLVLVDSGLLMSWVYTHSHLLVQNITLAEWELYEQMFDSFAKEYIAKSCVVRLKYSVPTLLARIQKRGRDYELAFYTKEYLEQLEEGLVALEKKLMQLDIPIIVIDESEVANFEQNSADARLLTNKVQSILTS